MLSSCLNVNGDKWPGYLQIQQGIKTQLVKTLDKKLVLPIFCLALRTRACKLLAHVLINMSIFLPTVSD